MNVLMIGDIVGSPGRKAVKELLPGLVKSKKIDFVIANAENAAGGTGITSEITEELFSYGVNVITMGDHVWKQKDVIKALENNPELLRPLNHPPMVPGKGYVVVPMPGDIKIAVINLVGRVFMDPSDCPFRRGMETIREIRKETPLIFVDFHAEATSEKMAFGWYTDGLVSAVCGTHTHVQTADERILPKGTAFLSDLGMTGPFDSVLGRDTEAVLKRFITLMPQKFNVSQNDLRLCGAVVSVDNSTGKALSIERVNAAAK